MASAYPGALDVFDAAPSTLAGPPTHSSLHAELANGLAAVQGELGINPGQTRLLKVCTSGTRPTGHAGLRIWETDTTRLLVHDGTNWIILSEPGQSFTPSWTNITVASSTNVGTYHRNDGYIDFYATIVFAAGSSLSGNPVLTLPKAGSLVGQGALQVTYVDASTAIYPGFNELGTTSVALYAEAAGGTYVAAIPTSATVPFTFGIGDAIVVQGRYQMASRYS